MLGGSCDPLREAGIEIPVHIFEAGFFKHCAKKSVRDKKTIEHIKFVGEEAEIFNTNMRTHALEEQNKFEIRTSGENENALEELEAELETDVFDFQIMYFSDKDALIQMLDTSKETMETKVAEKE